MQRYHCSLNTDQCDSEKPNICDPHHKHIILGDLRIIENKKLGNFYPRVQIRENPEV